MTIGPEDADERGDGSADAEPSRTTRQRIAELRARADELQRQAQERFDQERAQRSWVQRVVEAWDMDRHRGGPLLAGGLAYRIFLFELPALLFLVSLFGISAELSGEDPTGLARRSGISAGIAEVIAKALADSDAARWWLLFLGAWLTVWAARSGVRSVSLIASIAWRLPLTVTRVTIRGTGAFIAIMFSSFAIQALEPFLFAGDFGRDVLAWVAMGAITLVVCTVGLRLLPHRGSAWRPILVGAALLAVGLRGLSMATVYFAGRAARVDDIYGGLGFAIVILLYLYLAARVFVWAQFLNARLGGVTMETEVQGGNASAAGG